MPSVRRSHCSSGVVRTSNRHSFRIERLRRPHLAPAHDVVIAVASRERRDRRRIGAGVGFGHAERNMQIAPSQHAAGTSASSPRCRGAPPGAYRRSTGASRCAVHCRAGCGDLLEHDRCFADAATAAAVRLRNRDADPAGFRQRRIELPRKSMLGIERRPVLVRESAHTRRIASRISVCSSVSLKSIVSLRRGHYAAASLVGNRLATA